jgi:hypothetical protein
MIGFLNKRWHRLSAQPESGVALVMVIAVTAVLSIFISAAIVYGVSGSQKANSDDDWNASLAAAYAGVEEYQSRLSNDSGYVRYGNKLSSFTTASSPVTLPTGADVNPAFGLGATGTWAPVAGSANKSRFRYEVNTAEYSASGSIRLRSTGSVGTQTRSVVADLSQQGFVDFLWFTDYEIQDPEVSGKDAAACTVYEWAGRVNSNCGALAFGQDDTLTGPVHSNDTMLICGSTFDGKVTSSTTRTTAKKYIETNSSGSTSGCTPDFRGGVPKYGAKLPMPSTNTQMKREARSDLPVDVPRPGCMYTGPTSIVFNASGTITVRSPWTKKTRLAGEPATAGSEPAECGAISLLRSPGGATFTPPANNLLFVQNVPTTTSDPNFTASGSLPPDAAANSYSCVGMPGTASGSGVARGVGNGIGYPTTNEQASSSAYGCRNGDVFVKGRLKGQMTVASENYVYVVDNIVYNDPSADVLGLVGNNAVWVWQPVGWNSIRQGLLTNTNRRIDAAILSVAHTFQVQNLTTNASQVKRIGVRGELTVNGAIAQKYRGSVFQTYDRASSGYTKNYIYDTRLRFTAPPKFLSPVSTSYGVDTYGEVTPAFAVDGSPRS